MTEQTAQPSNDEPEVIIEQPEPEPDQEIPAEEPAEEYDGRSPVQTEDKKALTRIKYLDHQVRKSDERNAMYLEWMQKQQQELDDLRARFNQTDEAEAEKTILARIAEARDNGDTAKELQLIGELTDFKAEAKLKAAQPKQPKAQPKPTVETYGLNDEQIHEVYNIAMETDDTGNFTRPWLHDGHPRIEETKAKAIAISDAVYQEFGYRDVSEILSRLDRVMAKTPHSNQPQRPQVPRGNSRAPDPMGGNLTTRAPRGTLKLSAAEAEIARKLGVAPKAYAEARELHKR